MTATRAPSPGQGTARLACDGEQAAIARVLDEVFPDSLARPTGRHPLAGQDRQPRGTADAWSAPGVGLLAGVATATRGQGHGLGKSVTATALTALIHDYGTAALMVAADTRPPDRCITPSA